MDDKAGGYLETDEEIAQDDDPRACGVLHFTDTTRGHLTMKWVVNSDAIRRKRAPRRLADIKAAWIMAGEDIKDFTVMKFNKKLREEEKRDFNKNFISGNTDYEEKIDLLNRMRRTSTSWAAWESTRASGARCRAGSVERRGTDTATPSSRRRVDGVEEDATIQHERAVKL